MQILTIATILALSGLSQPIRAFVVMPTTRTNSIVPSSSSSYSLSTKLRMVVDDAMKGRLDGIKRSYQALTERLGDPDVVNDSNLLRKIMSERSTIEETVMAYDEYCTLAEELEGAKELFNSDDSDMKEMAREEMKEIEPQMEALQEKIKILMLPKDPNDDRNILLEIRAGTGGSEANIFAGKLHRRGSSVV